MLSWVLEVYEHKSEPLLPLRRFIRRQIIHILLGLGIIGVSLSLGIAGYHFLGRLAWIDALVNASMILGGMGPVDALQTVAGKIFASLYALYSGIVFLVVVGIMAAPIVHRVLHRLHMSEAKTKA
ncbi:MAG TPA: hypothetical protein VKT17_05745 [Acidobacteriota bacterium]|nr:hypothetical protein [Acidobacteriota bacterium]